VDAVHIIGGSAIQGRATVGGNLCNAAPSGDSIPRSSCWARRRSLPGRIHALRPRARLLHRAGKTVRQPSEMLVALRVPAPTPRNGAAYLRFTPAPRWTSR
jgi:carbon-monoxide dehydrogenase medium subunit